MYFYHLKLPVLPFNWLPNIDFSNIMISKYKNLHVRANIKSELFININFKLQKIVKIKLQNQLPGIISSKRKLLLLNINGSYVSSFPGTPSCPGC